MKNIILVTILAAVICVSGCKKENTNPAVTNWTGVYDAPEWSAFQQIVVTPGTNNTLQIQFKFLQTSYLYVATTVRNAQVNSMTEVTFDDTENITTYLGLYHIKGTMTMSGTHVTLAATATAVNDTIPESNVQTYSFSGQKTQ